MAGYQTPGPICSKRGEQIDDDTMCRSVSPKPGPLFGFTSPQISLPDSFHYSSAVRFAVDIPFSIAPGMTWDGFWRQIYDRTNVGFQEQANQLLKRGQITSYEANALVDSRNELLLRIRSRLTPFGELYSEIIKPSNSLKTLDKFLAEKGTIEAVLKSVGKTRAVVDKIGAISRIAGPASIVIEITLTAIVIQQASPKDKERVEYREVGGLVGSLGGGMGGMWAGCASAATLASPTLAIPVAGEVSTGGACLVGGILGGLGFGWLGRKSGEIAGDKAYQIKNQLSEFQWNKGN